MAPGVALVRRQSLRPPVRAVRAPRLMECVGRCRRRSHRPRRSRPGWELGWKKDRPRDKRASWASALPTTHVAVGIAPAWGVSTLPFPPSLTAHAAAGTLKLVLAGSATPPGVRRALDHPTQLGRHARPNPRRGVHVTVSPETLQEIALSLQEYQQIVDRLDREPNSVELGLFGALWSEHCGYKHSRPLLGLFPSDSPRMVVAPGAENAGVVDVGDGLAVVMKIESHNHPSAVEPFQGAATGVGGIVRDILTMGARPIALLNSLRFGTPDTPRQRHLLQGVVSGISWYGNCIGVPDVGGEVCFSPSYAENPLVNAMCVGLVQRDRIVRAIASGPGDLLLLVGADTGRDGIHGASGLASQTFEDERELRTTVQVGNPFMEKVLIEACLEALERFPESIAGMQDLGAAGLTSSVVECAGNSGAGVWIDVTQVPRRETGMTPYEVMLSESQERMLLIVHGGMQQGLMDLFAKWDLTSEVIGEITDGPAREAL